MNNKKNRFLIWLMWAPLFWCMGYAALAGWTLIQLLLLRDEEKVTLNRKIPMQDRPEIIEMNKPENLTEADKLFFSCHIQYTKERGHGFYKNGQGAYGYVHPKK